MQGTDLKYEIGDALGVFGHNADSDVQEFLAFYGVAEDDMVSIHRTGSQGEAVSESRSAFQWLQQVWLEHYSAVVGVVRRRFGAMRDP